MEDTQEIVEPEAVVTEEITQEESGETTAPESVEPAAEPKRDRVQERIDKITREKYDALREAEYLRGQLEAQKQPKPVETVQDVKPVKMEDFDTEEAYITAQVNRQTQERIDIAMRERDERVRNDSVRADRDRVNEAFKGRCDAFSANNPDFEAVAFNSAVQASEAVVEAVVMSDNGPAVAYHLGKNPAEAARISALSPTLAAIEIGKIESKLNAPQAKTLTQATAPHEPVGAGSSTETGLRDDMPIVDWMAQRNKDDAARRGM